MQREAEEKETNFEKDVHAADTHFCMETLGIRA